jgi:hypothetical protein
MWRWVKEFLRPSLKCDRVGHAKERRQTRTGYRYPSTGFRGVADDVAERRTVCSRCSAELTPWETIDRETINSLTMDSDRWAKLKRDGFLERSAW